MRTENPLMIDAHYQRRGVAKQAVTLMVEYLQLKYSVRRVNRGHRANNFAAAKLYEPLGFKVVKEYENGDYGLDHYRTLDL